VLGGNVDIFEYGVDRADNLALFAIDANFRVDVELRRARPRVNTGNRTDFDAGSIVGAQAGDDVRHGSSLSNKNSKLKIQKFGRGDLESVIIEITQC
jgi:hypothetical protein